MLASPQFIAAFNEWSKEGLKDFTSYITPANMMIVIAGSSLLGRYSEWKIHNPTEPEEMEVETPKDKPKKKSEPVYKNLNIITDDVFKPEQPPKPQKPSKPHPIRTGNFSIGENARSIKSVWD